MNANYHQNINEFFKPSLTISTIKWIFLWSGWLSQYQYSLLYTLATSMVQGSSIIFSSIVASKISFMVNKTIPYIMNAHHPLQYSIILWDKSSMVTAPSLSIIKDGYREGQEGLVDA